MELSNNTPTDHWTQGAYKASASFVPQLAQEIVDWLDPQPREVILDLGCGDGSLTAEIAEDCTCVDGFDASPNLIRSAASSHMDMTSINWHLLDCRYIETADIVRSSYYDKAFSNAALHWILRDASTRMSVLRGVYRALKSGGIFAFEMGGAGNVADVHAALLSALTHQGLSVERAREISPWFFPSEQSMINMLLEVGFQVQKSKMQYRPTKLTIDEGGGLEGWLRLMGAQFLEALDTDEKREVVVKEVCNVLQTVLAREDDGNIYLGYVRLRIVARKPT